MNTKYPKTTGHYNYAHILPNEMFYIGESGQQPSKRWKPSNYKDCSLGPYIEEYGWENIRHVVLKDGLTKDQAIKLEGLLIEEATRQGFCINKQGSGGKRSDNPKEYRREYNQNPEVKERQREYQKTEKYKEYQREYYQRPDVKERQREYQREYYQRPEVKQHRREKQREYSKKRRQTEKYKEYQREYMCEYRQRPEVKERQRENSRKYYQKKKALKN